MRARFQPASSYALRCLPSRRLHEEHGGRAAVEPHGGPHHDPSRLLGPKPDPAAFRNITLAGRLESIVFYVVDSLYSEFFSSDQVMLLRPARPIYANIIAFPCPAVFFFSLESR